MINGFSEQLALALTNFSVFQRGKEYFEDGLVKKIWKEGDEFKALVQGTDEYEVSIEFSGEETSTACTCPYEGDRACKHIIAAILAFSNDPTFAQLGAKVFEQGDTSKTEALLAQLDGEEAKIFLARILEKNKELGHDLKIFLQRQRVSPVTLTDFKNQFRRSLDKIDLEDLLTAWYQDGDDVYEEDYYPTKPGYDEETLAQKVDEFVHPARQNREFGNPAEALKIYQAAFETLWEKRFALKKGFLDLADWFDQEIAKCFSEYIQTLKGTVDQDLRRSGLNYLCGRLERKPDEIEGLNWLDGFKEIIKDSAEAAWALECLQRTRSKVSLSKSESDVLSFLYLKNGKSDDFEKISRNNLQGNPELVLELIEFYKRNERKKDAAEVAERVLKNLTADPTAFSTFELFGGRDFGLGLKIRQSIKNVLAEGHEDKKIENLKEILWATGQVADYRELTNQMETVAAKEKLLEEIAGRFSRDGRIRELFKIYRSEDHKEKVLELAERYPETESFSEMIRFIQKDFPDQSFRAYQNKIKKMLAGSRAKDYPGIVFHLKIMASLGLVEEFKKLIDWIRETYPRRRNLMNDLKELEKLASP